MQDVLICSQITEHLNYIKTFRYNNVKDLARINFVLRNNYTDDTVKQFVTWYNINYCSTKLPCNNQEFVNCNINIEEEISNSCTTLILIEEY